MRYTSSEPNPQEVYKVVASVIVHELTLQATRPLSSARSILTNCVHSRTQLRSHAGTPRAIHKTNRRQQITPLMRQFVEQLLRSVDAHTKPETFFQAQRRPIVD